MKYKVTLELDKKQMKWLRSWAESIYHTERDFYQDYDPDVNPTEALHYFKSARKLRNKLRGARIDR